MAPELVKNDDSNGSRGLKFVLSLNLYLYFMFASSEGSGQCANVQAPQSLCCLSCNVKSTKILCTGSCLCSNPQVQINKKFQRKNVNVFLPINFNICFGCSKEPSH